MLFDTDILIWMFRGNVKAGNMVNSAGNRCMSVITFMELLKGASNKKEASEIKRVIRSLDFRVIPVDENISHRALIYMEEHGLKSGIGVADALIAATAAEASLPLATANAKDYRSINDIELAVFRP